jgi:hypothetical protein
MTAKGWALHENVQEMLSECEEEPLGEEIASYIYTMAEDLEMAEKAWKK